jgi:DNA-binding response OmpR family regulator
MAVAEPSGQRARILIVDDEPDIACTMADGLELLGYITYVAHDATGALALTEGFAPDVALLDLGLPDLDGCELASRLLARHGKSLVVIAVTAYGDDTHRARAAEAGFDAYIVKPASLEIVRRTLERLLASRAANANHAPAGLQ